MSLKSELKKWRDKAKRLAEKLGDWCEKLDDVLEPAAAILIAVGLPQYGAVVGLIADAIHKAEKIGDVVGLAGEAKLDVAAGVLLAEAPDLIETDVEAEAPIAKRAIQLVVDEAVKALEKAA